MIKFKKVYIILLLLISFAIFSIKKTLIFGIPPWGGDYNEINNKYKPFVDYLAEKLNERVVFVVSMDYESLGESVFRGDIDFASVSPALYVKSKEKYPTIKYICTPILKTTGEPYYSSYIIARKDSGITKYSDLKDKIFGFVDEDSASGYKFPLLMMLTRWKIDPNSFFKKYFFLGSHVNVISAIYNKRIDAGGVYEKWEEDKKILGDDPFVVIDKYDNIPLDGVVASPYLSQYEITRLKNVLLSITTKTTNANDENITANLSWGGFVVKDDSFYEPIRLLSKIINQYNHKIK